MLEVPAHRLDSTRRIADRLRGASSIAVCTHVGGDGDGWGSACAIAFHFGAAGTDVRLLAASPYPERLRFLLPSWVDPLGPGEQGFESLRSAEVQVVVDASELGRLGAFATLYEPERTVVIDHHPVTASAIEATLTLVDPSAAATAELVYDVISCDGDGIVPGAALCLYVGLVMDTGSFRYSNTSARTHRLAAELIRAGVEPGEVYRPLFATATSAELGTIEAALAGLERDLEHGIAWTALPSDVAERFGALYEYEGIIDLVRNLQDTEVAVLVRDLGDGAVKVSLRATGPTDVASVARAFGGGGHEKAAGAVVEGELAEVTERIVEACRGAVRSALGGDS